MTGVGVAGLGAAGVAAPTLPLGSSSSAACNTDPSMQLPHAPFASTLSSASWQLTLHGVRPCALTGRADAEWDVRIRRDGVDTQSTVPRSAVRVNTTATVLTLVGVRCPFETGTSAAASSCIFALRLRDPSTNVTTPWSPDSAARNSRPIAAVPAGAARIEVRFLSADAVWGRWEGSTAQAFQRFAASQMSVSERSVRVVERFGDGAYLILDLVPSELGLTHMLDRLLAALQARFSDKGSVDDLRVAELRKVLPGGSTELLYTVSGGVVDAYAGAGNARRPSFASLPVAAAVSVALCVFLARSWQQQQRQYALAGKPEQQAPLDKPMMHDDDDSDAGSDLAVHQLSVHFAAACGEEMELVLPTGGVETPSDLRRTIWQRGNALMPNGLPSESKLRISFCAANGSERPLTSATMLAQVFEAGRINVSCSTEDVDSSETKGTSETKDACETEDASETKDVRVERSMPNMEMDMETGPQKTAIDLHLYNGGLSGSIDDEGDESQLSQQSTSRQMRSWYKSWEEPSPKAEQPLSTLHVPGTPPARTHDVAQDDDGEFVVPLQQKKEPSLTFAYPLD